MSSGPAERASIADMGATGSGCREIRPCASGAETTGRDYLTQAEEPVRAVLQVRLGITPSAALMAVNLVRRSLLSLP